MLPTTIAQKTTFPKNPPTQQYQKQAPVDQYLVRYQEKPSAHSKPFRDHERWMCFKAQLLNLRRTALGVIQQNNVAKWSRLELPKGYSSVNGDRVLLSKISYDKKADILEKFHNYFKQVFPDLTGIEDNRICQEKVVQTIARFVQENFLYTLGRNIDFSEMIEKRCGNCGDKAALFKLIVCLLKEKYPEKMEGITVDIIVQGAIHPGYLGVGGQLFVGGSSRGIKDESPDGEKYINTFHFLTRVTVSSGQAILLDLSDSSHLSEGYSKNAQQGFHVYPGDIAIDKQPDVNPFEEGKAYLLFLPIKFMGIMRILPDTDYDKLLFRNDENPMFELRLVGIQSCLFGIYQGKSFEEAKQQALDIMRNIRDLLNSDGTEDNLTQDPTPIKSFKPLIDKLSPKEKELLIQTFIKTIEKNEKPFTRPPSTIGKDAFILVDVINKATSNQIWDILQEQNILDKNGKINPDSTISKTSIGNLLPNENHAVIDHVLDVLYEASETEQLEFLSRISEAFEKKSNIQRLIDSVTNRTPLLSKL